MLDSFVRVSRRVRKNIYVRTGSCRDEAYGHFIAFCEERVSFRIAWFPQLHSALATAERQIYSKKKMGLEV